LSEVFNDFLVPSIRRGRFTGAVLGDRALEPSSINGGGGRQHHPSMRRMPPKPVKQTGGTIDRFLEILPGTVE
jgi:hypothetical protein